MKTLEFNRIIDLKLPEGKSAFLWGPRQVGKSWLIKHQLSNFPLIDLLHSNLFSEYAARPSLLRERYSGHNGLIVIDEIQKLPQLLDEVHWMIENTQCHFLLTGSSARKLIRTEANLLGGRAWRKLLLPLCYSEHNLSTNEDLSRAMLTGFMPSHFLSEYFFEDMRGYISDYLRFEISAEAQVQNLPAFSEFLRIAAITSSEMLTYTNLARETGTSQKTVREYFQILEDTFLAFRLNAWKKANDRRMIQTEKFYLFDIGVANFLSKRKPEIGSPDFGKSFEHFIFMELKAYQTYKNPELDFHYWRTSSGIEVDFILGDMEIAIEVKGSSKVHWGDLKGLKILREETSVKKAIVVCLETQPRLIEGKFQILPWKDFLEQLWSGELTEG